MRVCSSLVGRTQVLLCQHREELQISRLHVWGSATHLDMGSPSGLSLALLVRLSGLKPPAHRPRWGSGNSCAPLLSPDGCSIFPAGSYPCTKDGQAGARCFLAQIWPFLRAQVVYLQEQAFTTPPLIFPKFFAPQCLLPSMFGPLL